MAEHAGAHLEGKALAADERGREVDLDVEVEAGVGRDLAPAVAVLHADRLQHLDELARGGELADAGLVDGVDESRRLPSMIGTSLLSISM